MKFSILAGSLFAALASAVQITSQADNASVDQGSPITVTWTTVSTDPTAAHLVLSRSSGGQGVYRYDFGLVQLSAGSYSISKIALPSGSNYQFNFENPVGQNNMGIIAQSGQFTITGSASGATLTLPSAGTTGSATATGSGAASTTSGSTRSSSASTTTATTTSTSTSSATSGAVTTATRNAGTVNAAAGSSLFALLVGAVAAVF